MLWNDLRYALRLMRRNPGFATVAVLSLALGIGANTAVFSLFYTIMLRTLPVAHPEQLVEILQNRPDERHWQGYSGVDIYEHFRDHNHVFSAITGMTFENLASIRAAEGADAETLIVENVPGNYFRTLGLKPAIGRLIAPEDMPATGDGDVAVVSWSYWNTRLHRDPAVIGKPIWYQDTPKTIIGVAPRGYVGPRVGLQTDLWVTSKPVNLSMIARLKPGVTRDQAQAEMSVLYRVIAERRAARTHDPRALQATVELVPAATGLVRVRDQYGNALVLLVAVVGLLLLLGCINMASMLLARSAGRQREMAVRVGLGASRGRLVRQMLTESVLLSGAGTLLGVLLAYFGTGVLVRIMASGRGHERVELQVEPDLYLLLFTVAIALLTGLLFGLAPAWHAFRSAPASHLRQTGAAGDTWLWRLFGKGLVAAQVALSIVLVTGAVVFLGHLSQLRNIDLGFHRDHVLQVTIDPSRSGYRTAQLAPLYQDLLERLRTIPGVRSASISGCTPLQGCGAGSRFLIAEGSADLPGKQRAGFAFVTPGYFATLGIPLIAGQDFDPRDVGRRRTAIVSQAVARYYFPGGNPVGKHFQINREAGFGGWLGDDHAYEIVALAGDVKGTELREPPYPMVYFNMFQENRLGDQFELRTSVDPDAIIGTVRQRMREVVKGTPVTRVRTLEEQVDATIVPERLIATLSEFFGGLGAALAGIGLYGLLAYTVARRTNEIGVRMALGATPGRVSRLVMRDVMAMLAAGLLLGTLLVEWGRPLASRLIADLKFENATPLLLGGSAIVLVALAAAYVPVRRAVRVDPLVALRHE